MSVDALERLEAIRARVEAAGRVKVADLASELDVSEMTIRRDLDVLAEQGVVHRVRGGAMALGLGGAAQAAPVGMVDDPCPPPAAPDPLGKEMSEALVADAPFPPVLLAKLMDPARGAEAEKAKAEQAARDWADLCRYRPENAAALNAKNGGVEAVFMGDSITELWMVADPAFFSAARLDRGISGQTSAQMLLRPSARYTATR